MGPWWWFISLREMHGVLVDRLFTWLKMVGAVGQATRPMQPVPVTRKFTTPGTAKIIVAIGENEMCAISIRVVKIMTTPFELPKVQNTGSCVLVIETRYQTSGLATSHIVQQN